MRRFGSSEGGLLAAPARLRDVKVDVLEAFGLPSKSDQRHVIRFVSDLA